MTNESTSGEPQFTARSTSRRRRRARQLIMDTPSRQYYDNDGTTMIRAKPLPPRFRSGR